MKITNNVSLKQYNTFGIDVNANYFIEYDSAEDLQEVLNTDIVKQNRILHIGGGSNLLFLNDFNGVIIHSAVKSIGIKYEDSNEIHLEVGAGVVWDDIVAYCVENNWGGIENLSLIPGEVGSSAVQNIGAYGVEVVDVIEQVNAVEIETLKIRSFTVAECKYGYRDSVFKNELKGKYIITSVVLKLSKNPEFKLSYQHLEEEVKKNGAINLKNIRKTIIEVRERKLPDPSVLGNAGSFFMNPVVPKEKFEQLFSVYPSMPHYYVSESEEKIPAGWLIEQCGWKGKSIGNAAVHQKQALVLVNMGNATGQDIVFLAKQIQKSVSEKFGVNLTPEVNFI